MIHGLRYLHITVSSVNVSLMMNLLKQCTVKEEGID